MVQIERYGAVGFRAVEPAPELVFARDGLSVLAHSGRPFAEHRLVVFGWPVPERRIGPACLLVAPGPGRVAVVPVEHPNRVQVHHLPDLSVVEVHDLPHPVAAVSYAPGRDQLVAALVTGEIVCIDWEGERQVVARTARPTALGFSAAGERVAVGTSDGLVEIVRLDRTQVVVTLQGGRSAVSQVGFSPDGQWVVAAAGPAARVWPSRGGPPVPLVRAASAVHLAGFTSAGHVIVSAIEHAVAAYDPATGERVWETPAYGPTALHGDRIWSARFQEVRAIDPGTGEVLRSVTAPRFVASIAPVPEEEDRALVAFATGTELRVVDLATGAWTGGGEGHADEVLAVDFDREGGRFVTGGRDARVCVWRVGDPHPWLTATAPSEDSIDVVCAVRIESPRGAVYAGFGERVGELSLGDGRWVRQTHALGASVTLLAVAPPHLLVCTAASPSRVGWLYLLDEDSLEVVHRESVDRTFTRARVRSDGTVRLDGGLAAGIYDPGARRFLDLRWIAARSSSPGRQAVRSLDGSLLVEVEEAGPHGLLHVTELPAGWPLIEGLLVEEIAGQVDLAPSGLFLAIPHADGRVRIRDLRTGACTAEWDLGERLAAVWFFPDEWRVLGATADGRLVQLSEPLSEQRVRSAEHEAPSG